MKNHENIIRDYGQALKKGSSKTLVDLDRAVNINFNFQLHSINDLVKEFNGIMPPNRISHYVMAFIQNGEGLKTIGNYSFEIQPDLGMIFPKNVIHSTNNWSLDTSGFMLTFNDSLFEKYQFPRSFLQLHKLFKLSIIPHKCFSKSNSEKSITLFKELIKLSNAKTENERKMFVIKLSELILIYQNEFLKHGEFSSSKSTLFDSFVELLEANYKKEREVAYYASELHVHSNYLNSLIRYHSNLSAKEYINRRVMQDARYMLVSTSIPVKEIAFDLGFMDYNYFSRLFKRLVKCSPQQFRADNL